MVGWYLYLTFVLVLGVMACVVLVLKTHQYFPRKGRVLCPETREPAAVRLDAAHALRTFFTNVEELRIKDCERWPERAECKQECLLQVDAKPALLDRTLGKFYEGRFCARCNTALTPNDWKQGSFAVLSKEDEYLPAAQIPLNRIPMALDGCRPLCRACHKAEASDTKMETASAA